MNRKLILSVSSAALLAVSFGVTGTSMAASSEISDLDSKLQAKVARERIKQRSPRRGKQRGENADCGNVEIGNNNSDNGSARQRINPRDNTVIVTGPIINAANCR